jgi:hypothetical protein
MGFTPRKVDQYAIKSIGSHDYWYTPGRPGATACSTNTPWVANLGVYVPFRIHERITIYEWWWTNGTLTTAHNVDFGVYNEDFTQIQSLGSTVGATTASLLCNTSTWTDLTLDPGSYYMAFSDSSIRNIVCSADAAGLYQAMGVMEQASALPLPSPAVPVAYTRAFLPAFGMNLHSVAF